MGNMEILDEEPISMLEAKNELAKIKKRDKELSFRANKAEEYLNMFAKDSQKKYKELYAALEKLKIPRLKDMHMKKLIDVKPKTMEDVKLVLQNYPITITQDNLKKIAKVLSS